MAFVYSIDEFGNIHTDDVTHITSNRGDGIIWRHAHEIFDDHIHTTSLSSGLYMVMLQEIVHDADSIYCSVATYFSDRTIIKDVVLVRALISNFEALLCKYVTSIGGIILLEELLSKVDNVHKSPSKYVSEYIYACDSQLLHLSIPTIETLLCDHKTSIGGHIYLSNVLNIRDILTPGSIVNYLKEVLQVTHTEHSSSKIYLDAINKIQDTIISHPIIKFFDAIVTSDVVMIAKDIIKRIHNTATATKQKLTNAITIRRQL